MSQTATHPHTDTALEAWVRLLHGHSAATRALSAELQAEHGLTINDYEALLRLSRARGGYLRRVDLARELLLTPSGVTRLLEGLERAGWVRKRVCRSDARVSYAELTASGRAKLETAARSHVGEVQGLFRGLYDEEELMTLASLLGRLSDGGEDESCSPDNSPTESG